MSEIPLQIAADRVRPLPHGRTENQPRAQTNQLLVIRDISGPVSFQAFFSRAYGTVASEWREAEGAAALGANIVFRPPGLRPEESNVASIVSVREHICNQYRSHAWSLAQKRIQ